jgi:hypothetical protein
VLSHWDGVATVQLGHSHALRFAGWQIDVVDTGSQLLYKAQLV